MDTYNNTVLQVQIWLEWWKKVNIDRLKRIARGIKRVNRRLNKSADNASLAPPKKILTFFLNLWRNNLKNRSKICQQKIQFYVKATRVLMQGDPSLAIAVIDDIVAEIGIGENFDTPGHYSWLFKKLCRLKNQLRNLN